MKEIKIFIALFLSLTFIQACGSSETKDTGCVTLSGSNICANQDDSQTTEAITPVELTDPIADVVTNPPTEQTLEGFFTLVDFITSGIHETRLENGINAFEYDGSHDARGVCGRSWRIDGYFECDLKDVERDEYGNTTKFNGNCYTSNEPNQHINVALPTHYNWFIFNVQVSFENEVLNIQGIVSIDGVNYNYSDLENMELECKAD
ncbi:MAG: hypothetical protein COS89_05305 [Deltaproteobacteria bacterium CG07_land_8_20_14_0_80_38_7]|nr:MAG: hypothetical protein COS89_05305 [Deltaproteobacteria bacterium CG07_land_8_20_14_0_80_38_7]